MLPALGRVSGVGGNALSRDRFPARPRLQVHLPEPQIPLQARVRGYVDALRAARALRTERLPQLVVFDTAIVDLTEDLKDVDVLFGVQLGGGTDINQALAYCERLVVEPGRTHLILISDLYEGGNAGEMLARAKMLVVGGVNLIVLLALNDDGRSAYDANHAAAFASMGCPVFACTPDQFPELMASAVKRADIWDWAASRDIALIRGA